MKLKFSQLIAGLLSLVAIFFVFSLSGCSSNKTSESHSQSIKSTSVKKSSSTTSIRQLTERDVVGTWINHKDKNIHQKIVFHANHTWNEDQHGTKNIYHGSWKITGKRTINLQPWDEDIVFSKGNYNEMTVVAYDHTLTKEK